MTSKLPVKTRFFGRLPMALGVALACAVALGTALGAGLNSDAPEATFHVPQARIGDEASYSTALRGDWLFEDHEPDTAFGLVGFRWLGAEDMRDEHGAVRRAEVLQLQGLTYAPQNAAFDEEYNIVQGPAWLKENQTAWFVPNANRILAFEGQNAFSMHEPGEGPVGPMPMMHKTLSTHVSVRQYPDGAEMTHCLAADHVQGHDLRVGDTLTLPACLVHSLDYLRPAGRFTAMAVEQVGGLDALRMEGNGVTMWWASELAFPVRYEASHEIHTDYQNHRGNGAFVLELTGFRAGTQNRGNGEAAGAGPGPMPMALRQPWGMDETGVDHTFPASEAFASAKELSAAFAELLRRSPDAYLATALEHSLGSGDDRESLWRLTLTDGEDAVHVAIAKRTSPGVNGAPTFYVGTPWPEEVTATTVTLYLESKVDGSRFPPASVVPRQWPTVAGLAERWNLYQQEPQPFSITGWGHRVTCADEDCKTTGLHVGVGHFSIDREDAAVDASDPSAPVILERGTTRQSVLEWNATSERAMGFYESGTEAGYETDLTGGAVPPASAAHSSDAGAFIANGFWSSPQAAGVGVFALLLGAVYWLWPAIKSGGIVGLFSRLRDDRLLDHPLRTRIIQAIEADPGVHFSELLRRTGIPNGSLHYHLQVLRKAARVDASANQGYTCYFPRGIEAAAQRAASAAKADGARRILALVRSTPGLSVKQVAVECGLRPSTVSYHVQRLIQAGLVDAARNGREVQVRARVAAGAMS